MSHATGVPYYYSDRSTLELDWNGIKHKIAQLLVPLRQPPAVIPSVCALRVRRIPVCRYGARARQKYRRGRRQGLSPRRPRDAHPPAPACARRRTEGQGERQRQLRWPVFSVLTLTAGVRATVQVEERERQEANVRKSKLALIDLCRMEATKFLVHGDFEMSIPGAVQALRYSLDVYGAGKIELVPSYLLLAEANLGLGRHKMAEEYLSLANWSILKNPDCSNRTKSQLYRNFGKLYASQGKHDEALRQLANDVYFSSLQVCLRVRARGRVCLCVHALRVRACLQTGSSRALAAAPGGPGAH